MATLYGTTADVESLPVQVNEFGQLVAQGLPGEQGIQGPPGPEGPISNVEEEFGSFDPTFGSSTEGEAFITYDYVRGFYHRFGKQVGVWVYIRTSEVVVTDARGSLIVEGLPSEWALSNTLHTTGAGMYSMSYARIGEYSLVDGLRPVLNSGGTSWTIFRDDKTLNWDPAIPFPAIEENDGRSIIGFAWSGFAADAVKSVEVELDELM